MGKITANWENWKGKTASILLLFEVKRRWLNRKRCGASLFVSNPDANDKDVVHLFQLPFPVCECF